METDLSDFLGKVDFLLDSKESSPCKCLFLPPILFFCQLFSRSVLLISICLTLTPKSVLGELYFLATGAPSATARAGYIYKIVDPSRYLTVKEFFSRMHSLIVCMLVSQSCLGAVWWP